MRTSRPHKAVSHCPINMTTSIIDSNRWNQEFRRSLIRYQSTINIHSAPLLANQVFTLGQLQQPAQLSERHPETPLARERFLSHNMQQEFDVDICQQFLGISEIPGLEIDEDSGYEASGGDNDEEIAVHMSCDESVELANSLPIECQDWVTAGVYDGSISVNAAEDDSKSVSSADTAVGVGLSTNRASPKVDSRSHDKRRCDDMFDQIETTLTEHKTIEDTSVERRHRIGDTIAHNEAPYLHFRLNDTVKDKVLPKRSFGLRGGGSGESDPNSVSENETFDLYGNDADDKPFQRIKDALAQNGAAARHSRVHQIFGKVGDNVFPNKVSNAFRAGKRDDGFETVKKNGSQGETFASNTNNRGRQGEMFDKIKEGRRHGLSKPLPSKGSSTAEKAAYFLQWFSWYIRFDIAAPQDAKTDDPHVMLLELEEKIDDLCQSIVRDSFCSELKLYLWPTLFVRCSEEATKSRIFKQDAGTFLIGLQLVGESDSSDSNSTVTVSGDKEAHRPRHPPGGCDPLRETPPFSTTNMCSICAEWGGRFKIWLPQFEDKVRQSATFSKCRATNSLTAIMARLVRQEQLGPLVLDEWIWKVRDRRPTKYEHCSPPTITGYLWNCNNAIVSPLAKRVNPRPFQIIARILRNHPGYSREWSSYLCGFYDYQGFKEVTLEYWLACQQKQHVHSRSCSKSCRRAGFTRWRVCERDQISNNGFPSQCRPKAWDIVSVRRHRTLEVVWHKMLGIDGILRPPSISSTGLPGVPEEEEEQSVDGKCAILQRPKPYSMQTLSRSSAHIEAEVSAHTSPQTSANDPDHG